jgi:TonB family protein
MIPRISFSLLAAMTYLASPSASHAQSAGMAKLAEQAGHKISGEGWKAVIVWDFSGQAGKYSKLGVALADEFSATLSNSHPNFDVIERSRIAELAAEEKLNPKAASDPIIIGWMAKKLGANGIIFGDTEASSDGVYLELSLSKASDAKPAKKSFRADVALTDEQKALLDKPRGDPWKPARITAARNYVKPPQCTYCPPAPFSDEARRLKLEGVVIVLADVSEEGEVTNVQLVQGLPFGLNETAMETIRTWKFKPAVGRDDNPVAASVPVEVSFHLY